MTVECNYGGVGSSSQHCLHFKTLQCCSPAAGRGWETQSSKIYADAEFKNIRTQVKERQLLSLHSVFYLKLNSPQSKIFLNYFYQYLTLVPLTLYTQYCPIRLNQFKSVSILRPPLTPQ